MVGVKAMILLALPDELRRLVLQHLAVHELLVLEAVSKALRETVQHDEACWQPRCAEQWPTSNRGNLMSTHRECYLSANGWLHLSRLPRSLVDCSAAPHGAQRASRRSAPAQSVYSFDAAADDVLVYSHGPQLVPANEGRTQGRTVALHSQLGVVSWDVASMTAGNASVGSSVRDVKLLPEQGGGNGPAALALVSCPPPLHNNGSSTDAVVRLGMDVADGGIAAASPVSVWRSHAAWGPDEMLMRDATQLVIARHEPKGMILCVDLACGKSSSGLELPSPIRSICNTEGSPFEVTYATISSGRSFLHHVDMRCGVEVCTETGHGWIRRVRSGGAGTHAILTSHTRSKEIEVWDLRKFGRGAQHQDAPRADAFHCSGNAPDFCCAHGVVCAISGGAPGTTYGAKLYAFATSPRRVAAECVLPEIVVDDGYRLGCPVGVKLTGRTLTVVADRQRLLRCWIP